MLKTNIKNQRGLIKFENYIIYFDECTDEYAINYYLLNNCLEEIDGGLLCYGEYNKETELYDKDTNNPVTIEELLDLASDNWKTWGEFEYITQEEIVDEVFERMEC